MKNRIASIMDTGKKKLGIAILCGALVLTLGTGFAFAANGNSVSLPHEIIDENIVTSLDVSYMFLPNPNIYEKYLSYGITISTDGTMLNYNGQRVRLFVDEHSDVEAFFWDEDGTLDLSVIRNSSGEITNIERISEEKAQVFRSAFFADTQKEADEKIKEKVGDLQNQTYNPTDFSVNEYTYDYVNPNKYGQYLPYGITFSADNEILYYNGLRVRLFVDERSDGFYESLWEDEAGTIDLSVVRNSSDEITNIEHISQEKAQEFRSAFFAYTQQEVDEKIKDRMWD